MLAAATGRLRKIDTLNPAVQSGRSGQRGYFD